MDTVHADENGISQQLSTLALNGDDEQSIPRNPGKDPRKIARKYQLDLCKKALEENVIVYLETGCGKTLIAVLLIYEMASLIKKPQKDICIFLAPTVALVQQQAKVIETSIDFKVGICCGSSTKSKSGLVDWENKIAEYEVLVMTPQILVHGLSHCFIRIEQIALLIFDECHYAQLESNHTYAEIMKNFYKMDAVKLPRIFGMTASPKLGKGGSIDGLEALLRAKVCPVEDKNELEKFVTSPIVKVYCYSSVKDSCHSSHMIYARKLEEIKHQSMSSLRMSSLDQNTLKNTKKSLIKLHCNLFFCLENLGLWGALQASYIYLKGDHYEKIDMVEEENSGDSNLCNKYMYQVASVLASDCTGDGKEADLSSVEVLEEPYFSRKFLRLIGILSSYRLQPNMKCIIFVNRIVTARSLTYILQNLKFLSSWKCGFLVGVHSGLLSRKNTNIILEKFRSGELNLLVATKVGEEGLDIQTCCLVIRFDLPETVASFIQSRGRARMPQSEYALLVDSGNPRELNLIEHFKKDEAEMNEEISLRKSSIPISDFEERTYKVDTTGATISSISSISLLHHYCSKLPHDEYFNPKPQFFYYDDADGMVCSLILPANAPIHQIVSSPQPSNDLAKRDACLKACKSLHEVGALTDYLLPEQDDTHEELTDDLSDFDVSNEESRAELYKMFVPTALRKPWAKVENPTCFSCYYIDLCPTPADRVYRRFALYMKEPLPEEAGKMEVDLCLARGRKVKSQIIWTGVTRFDKDEIAAAEMFQEMFLKIILDRHQFIPEYVSLGNHDVYEPSSSTFYLLLPLVPDKHDRISVDWTLVKRCLSSPTFKHPHVNVGDEVSQLSNYLHLVNGHLSVDDVVNSLVYVPCKNTFYFISGVIQEKNGHSLYDDSKSHVKHYNEKFHIDLAYPDQPLLKAKQLFVMDNLLRKKRLTEEWREKEEHFIEIPPEICQLKVIGFSKDIGSSLSLLPSIMHRLESFLVAIELKDKLVASFPEGAEITAHRILEALTTERCSENFSLERLEVLGDAFLKFAVGRHVFLKHDLLDEGQLTAKRSSIVNNCNLFKLATRKNLQVYIRDQTFEPKQFYAFGRRCPLSCSKEAEESIHSQGYSKKDGADAVRCNKCHQWLYNKTIADALEALIGAFIVDSGFKAAIAFLNWIGIKLEYTSSQIDSICSASKAFLPLSDQMDVNALENLLGYKFTNKGLLIQAFVHPSFNNHLGGCYQRLEFLGDAVLDYLITSYLYSVYPNLRPGHLTDLRSVCVSNISFADVAGRWSFDKFIICDSSALHETITRYVKNIGRSAIANGHIEEKACPKVLGDLVESCMGAIYLDTGFNLRQVWKMMQFMLNPIISLSKLQQINPLRELHELCQNFEWEIQFSKLKKDGRFTVEAKVDERSVSASATATNISGKTAKRMASRQLFECLKAKGYKSKTASLEEIVKTSKAMEAKLIGYDETPSCKMADSGGPKLQEDSQSDRGVKSCRPNGTSTTKHEPVSTPPLLQCKPSEVRVTQAVPNNGGKINPPATGCGADSNGKGTPSAASAKSHLYELCTANYWKPPIFECCLESGPSHLREFVFKVVLEMEETPNETYEFFGEFRARKKEAAEHAAQGALWYLKHEGYVWDKKRNN